jgi:hypothetical protein
MPELLPLPMRLASANGDNASEVIMKTANRLRVWVFMTDSNLVR